MKAMLFAAGLGTRLKPWTEYHPKALAVVNGQSLLQRNILYLQQYGIRDVVVNIHHFADQIEAAVTTNNGWGSTITISDERDAVLETGGGLQKAAPYFAGTGDFLVMNVDILTDLDINSLVQQHRAHQPLATLATSNRQSSRYFLFNTQNRLCGWRNAKTGEEKIVNPQPALIDKAFSGIHLLNERLFSLIRQQGKFSMVDVYLSLAAQHTIESYDHSGSRFIDVGKPESILQAEKMFV